MSLKPKKILVTGGLGFLGAPLCRALLTDGHAVRILDDASRGRIDKLGDAATQVEIVQADIRDAAAVTRAAQGIDSIFHLAYVNGTRFFYERPRHVLDVGVRGMLNVLDASAAAGVRELVLASSSEVYQTPPSVPTDEQVPLSIPDVTNPRYSYGGGKIVSELLALHHGREIYERVLVFRPHNVYGPNMGWEHVIPELTVRMKRLADAHPGETVRFPIQGDGAETRAFVFIDDFVEGIIAMWARGEHLGIYNVGTREEVRIAALAEKIAAAVGVRIVLQPGPARAGGTPRRCPDITKLAALGYQPRIAIDEGLARTVPWYVANAERAPA